MQNPFDIQSALLARHAQHVVLVHFPIGLFITGVVFDLLAFWTKRRGLADAAYYDLLGAAVSTLPVVVTGILAWQFATRRPGLERHSENASDLGMPVEYCHHLCGVDTHFFYRRRKQRASDPSYRRRIGGAGFAIAHRASWWIFERRQRPGMTSESIRPISLILIPITAG